MTNMDTIAGIDMRISMLESELVTLRQRRNRLIPFSQVPTELILQIIKLLQEPVRRPDHTSSLRDVFREPSDIFNETASSVDISWLKLASACKWMRDLVLSTLEIWQASGAWMPGNDLWRGLCLQRSQGLPSHIHVVRYSPYQAYDQEQDSVLGDDLNDQLQNAAEAYIHLGDLLEVKDYDSDIEEKYHFCLHGDFPHLRSLSVYRQFWTLTEETFCSSADVLTTLLLSNVVYLADGQPSFGNLRNFMITVIEDTTNEHQNDLCLLAWISSFRSLEILSIQYTYKLQPRGQLMNTSVLPLVSLPKLRILRLVASTMGLVKLLAPFSIGQLTGLDMTILEPELPTMVIKTDPMLSSSYNDLLRSAVEFWHKHQLNARSPDPLHVALINPSSQTSIALRDTTDHTRLSMRSTPMWQLVDNTCPFCFFDGPYIESDGLPRASISALYINEDPDYGASYYFSTQYDIDDMPLHSVFVEGMKTGFDRSRYQLERSTMERLQEWLIDCKKQGQAIRRLYIGKQATKQAQHEMEIIGLALRNDHIVEVVEWCLQ